MTSTIDWNRYAVVHWTVDQIAMGNEVRRCGRTRAFAELAEAVLFATGLESGHGQTARIDCGGKTYHASDIERLAARPDFPHLPEVAVA
ncbi:hypothetical protein [Methylobacterium nigriterrae]|uniref:hypothetical protein n=1 Tax=Methylobacterium nigriterrae TaxID=3127512 RepID=UPI00301392A4